jgi:hypothetical protein
MTGLGMMMGPGMMGRGSFGAMMCHPRAAGLAEWRMDRIESAIKPTEAQRTALNDADRFGQGRRLNRLCLPA